MLAGFPWRRAVERGVPQTTSRTGATKASGRDAVRGAQTLYRERTWRTYMGDPEERPRGTSFRPSGEGRYGGSSRYLGVRGGRSPATTRHGGTEKASAGTGNQEGRALPVRARGGRSRCTDVRERSGDVISPPWLPLSVRKPAWSIATFTAGALHRARRRPGRASGSPSDQLRSPDSPRFAEKARGGARRADGGPDRGGRPPGKGCWGPRGARPAT